MIAVEGLVIAFGDRRVVDGVSLSIAAGETVGVVGESGSGKTMTALSILQLVPEPGRELAGRWSWEGQPLTNRRALRGSRVGMVFQEPLTALNPVYTIGDQLAEALMLHRPLPFRAAREAVIRALAEVGIPAPEVRADDHPHALSGGMRQRVMIAMALIAGPALLVADEPTTALDVTVQAQVLALLARLQAERGMAMLLVSHDLAVIASSCRRVLVMYGGRIVEEGAVDDVLSRPIHPYTEALIAARPETQPPGRPLVTIAPRTSDDFPSGCRFRDRCPFATDVCASEPPLVEREPGHRAWCAHPRW